MLNILWIMSWPISIWKASRLSLFSAYYCGSFCSFHGTSCGECPFVYIFNDTGWVWRRDHKCYNSPSCPSCFRWRVSSFGMLAKVRSFIEYHHMCTKYTNHYYSLQTQPTDAANITRLPLSILFSRRELMLSFSSCLK